MMNIPIVDFVRDYVNQNNLRLHMPGHKGKNILGFEQFDITEISGADLLYSADGIIKESQNNASELFGTQKTVYSCEGSSLCIRAMLCLLKMYAQHKKETPLIFAGRNAHKAFLNALAVLDLEVEWLLPKDKATLISCNITADYLEEKISSAAVRPTAVYITSPDYLGNILDIAAISVVCKKYGVVLIVDNAHGAYLKFLPQSSHPIDLGADMCCDSAHKTLPVITGGAYLHISKNADPFFKDNADNAMALFASTSPSYLILQSLDMANKYISDSYNSRLADFVIETEALKKELKEYGYQVFSNEPIKITIAPKSYGYSGIELSEILEQKGIFCEFADPDFVVIMLTPEIEKNSIEKLKSALFSIDTRNPIISFPPKAVIGKKRMTVKEAFFSASEEIETKDAKGRIIADITVSCPPAIPIAICGEEIDSESVKAFEYYGKFKCRVVKE